MEIGAELLTRCSVEEIKRGFIEHDEGYTCMMCGEHFDKGEIYTFSGKLYEGSKAVKLHIEEAHHSVQEFLLSGTPSQVGISELQLQLLSFFSKGISDKQIAQYLGVSSSTIRNHRHKLRERERQNKLFVVLMENMRENGALGGGQAIDESGRSAVLGDIREKERRTILDRYIDEEGTIKEYPASEQSRRIILEDILSHFRAGISYTEEQISQVLCKIYEDYKFLRDELISYNYLYRTQKGAIYWINGSCK